MCFYARTLAEHFPLAVDMICDILLHPLFEADRLEMKKCVIIQEIRSIARQPPEDASVTIFFILLAISLCNSLSPLTS